MLSSSGIINLRLRDSTLLFLTDNLSSIVQMAVGEG